MRRKRRAVKATTTITQKNELKERCIDRMKKNRQQLVDRLRMDTSTDIAATIHDIIAAENQALEVEAVDDIIDALRIELELYLDERKAEELLQYEEESLAALIQQMDIEQDAIFK